MSKTLNTGGSAFPAGVVRITRECPHDNGSDWVVKERLESAQSGMTLRDYFATKALPWVCSGFPATTDFYKHVAEKSYALADAMIEARKAKEQP